MWQRSQTTITRSTHLYCRGRAASFRRSGLFHVRCQRGGFGVAGHNPVVSGLPRSENAKSSADRARPAAADEYNGQHNRIRAGAGREPSHTQTPSCGYTLRRRKSPAEARSRAFHEGRDGPRCLTGGFNASEDRLDILYRFAYIIVLHAYSWKFGKRQEEEVKRDCPASWQLTGSINIRRVYFVRNE